MSIIPKTTDSPQLQLVHSLIDSFRRRDVDHLATLLHKDHRRIYRPRSLGKPEETKEQWLKNVAEATSQWTDCQPTVHSLIAETPGKIIIHGTNRATTSVGVEMVREMILIVHIIPDEDGSLKIKILEEFTDSKAHHDFIKAVAAAKLDQGA